MSISYEEALSTLQSMFGPPWTRETLDAVLRFKNGHMEDTVDVLLKHGDRDPQILVEQIHSGVDPDNSARELDEQLARQLQQANMQPSSTETPRKGRGTPITLPDDFLRVPGFNNPNPSMVDDEALARMLQDELFTQELARNPDFAHLARGRPRTVGGLPVGTTSAQHRVREPHSQVSPMPNIVEKISELGDNARRRLQLLVAQYQAKNSSPATSPTGNAAAAERRGLLDDTDDMELAARKDL